MTVAGVCNVTELGGAYTMPCCKKVAWKDCSMASCPPYPLRLPPTLVNALPTLPCSRDCFRDPYFKIQASLDEKVNLNHWSLLCEGMVPVNLWLESFL